ncbi:MAG: class I SAM-dependent methyltransferase [Thalassobaculum sp.]|uniref:class I SAM-dependent methyltransferase n=1 Tax=Thalassobaculum sp. TaxID=2022740 RepID=UPI0032EBC415
MPDNTHFLEANRVHWDELVGIHLGSSGPDGYNVEALKRGARPLHAIEEAELGPVDGLDVLHLQCHFGDDSLILAQRGARITGLDYSPAAVAAARGLAAEIGLDARFVEGNVYDAPSLIDGRFDLVFVTWGTICWLPDLPAWARVVAHFLKPGGRFYFCDAHPAARVFDDSAEAAALPLGTLRVHYPYFHRAEPTANTASVDYADPEAEIRNQRTYEWEHSVSDVVNAVIGAGLRLDWLHEHDEIAWSLLPVLVPGAQGQYRWPDGFTPKLPLSLSLSARKV